MKKCYQKYYLKQQLQLEWKYFTGSPFCVLDSKLALNWHFCTIFVYRPSKGQNKKKEQGWKYNFSSFIWNKKFINSEKGCGINGKMFKCE